MFMSGKKLPKLPEELEEYLNKPYGGLFGNTVLAQVVEEIIADPTMDYRPRYLEEMTGKRPPSIREALKTLVRLGLIENISSDVQHPVYRVVVESKKLSRSLCWRTPSSTTGTARTAWTRPSRTTTTALSGRR